MQSPINFTSRSLKIQLLSFYRLKQRNLLFKIWVIKSKFQLMVLESLMTQGLLLWKTNITMLYKF